MLYSVYAKLKSGSSAGIRANSAENEIILQQWLPLLLHAPEQKMNAMVETSDPLVSVSMPFPV